MNIAAIYHRPLDNWCYPLDNSTLHIRIQTAVDDVDSVEIVTGDPFDWKGNHWNSHVTSMRKSGRNGVHQFWESEYSPPWKRSKYFFLLNGRDAHGHPQVWEFGERGVFAAHGGGNPERHRNAFCFPSINAVDVFRAPDWVAETVWYQVFPERFANGKPEISPPGVRDWHRGQVTNREFYGGDLHGITGRLDHIVELGCNGLYLTPIFLSPSVHKYDTVDYMKIDPTFGTEDDLRALVEGCHRRGIRLILDAVFNHSGALFAPWQDVVKNKAASRYADWFHIRDFDALHPDPASGNRKLGYATFSFAASMPKLNTANPEVREYLFQATRYWMEFGIDGWRLDVSNEVDHDFWREYRKVVKAKNPEAFIVGEIWHDSMQWLRGDQYDAVMNYRYGNAVSDFVLGINRMDSARDFADAVDGIDASYPLPVIRNAFNVLDSHDTDRFITRCGGDKARARLGWLLLFLLRGSPCVYYGSEVGMEGGQDPDNRRCMIWDPSHQDQEQFDFLKSMTRLRIQNAALITHGKREWVTDPAKPNLLGLTIAHGGKTLKLNVNRSAHAADGLGAWGYVIE